MEVKGFLAIGIDDYSPPSFAFRNTVAHGAEVKDLDPS